LVSTLRTCTIVAKHLLSIQYTELEFATMSRSALWHQEKNVNRRSKEADETWEAAIEEGRNNRARNLIPLFGPDDSFRFDPMMLNSIKTSQYFLKICREITSWTALVDEIYYKVEGIEPWALGT